MDVNKAGSGPSSTLGTITKQTGGAGQKTGVSADSTDSNAGSRSDTLTVTQEAARLLKLEKELLSDSAMTIDSGKVDSIRQQIESGSYSIDSAAIATALLISEQGLP